MSDLDPALRQRIDDLVGRHPVLLFMKGTRGQPRCGFSARVVGVLDGLLEDYATIDVLMDEEIRGGMKLYGDWPTFPQLWVGGQLVGGCDIVEQLDRDGELPTLLGVSAEAVTPSITVSEEAAAHIARATGMDAPHLRLRVPRDFRYRFEEVDHVGAGDVVVQAGGVTFVLDRGSARRADGMRLHLEEAGGRPQLVIDNPNEPPRVTQLDVGQLAAWRQEGLPHALIDVRTPEEWEIARIDGARLLDDAVMDWLETAPRDTALVFQCHHGSRSQRAAEHFLARGFTRVFNLAGGIEAWSRKVDPSVPRY